MTEPLTRELFWRTCLTIYQLCPNGYAASYARGAHECFTPESMRVQALYILNNMSHWRGDEAKRCRAIMKRFAKEQWQ